MKTTFNAKIIFESDMFESERGSYDSKHKINKEWFNLLLMRDIINDGNCTIEFVDNGFSTGDNEPTIIIRELESDIDSNKFEELYG